MKLLSVSNVVFILVSYRLRLFLLPKMIEEKIKDSEPVKSLKNKTRDLLLILIIIRIWERILCSSASLLFQSFVFVFLCLWWHCFEFWLLGDSPSNCSKNSAFLSWKCLLQNISQYLHLPGTKCTLLLAKKCDLGC